MDVSSFGINCKKYREAAGISQRLLADFCQTSPNLIGLYESGKRSPTLRNAVKIATVLRVTLNDLCEDHETITK